MKKFVTKEKTSSVSIHPDHKKFVAGSDQDLWVRIHDFESGEVSGNINLVYLCIYTHYQY